MVVHSGGTSQSGPPFAAVQVRRWDCDVPCEFSMDASRPFDGDLGGSGGTYKVLRSMEAASYYAQNNPTTARQSGFDVSAIQATLACAQVAHSTPVVE